MMTPPVLLTRAAHLCCVAVAAVLATSLVVAAVMDLEAEREEGDSRTVITTLNT